jgi:hypothetical protein
VAGWQEKGAAAHFCDLHTSMVEPAFFQDVPTLMQRFPDNPIWR